MRLLQVRFMELFPGNIRFQVRLFGEVALESEFGYLGSDYLGVLIAERGDLDGYFDIFHRTAA